MNDKRALVTGAGARLGQAMAVYLAERGYDVAVHYATSAEGAADTVAQIAAKGRRGVALQADLLVEAETQTLVDRAAGALDGPLSVLVNADGRYFVGDREVLRTDTEALKRSIADVAGEDRARPVLLRADARTPHQAVVTAYEAVGQLGFKQVMIATAPEQRGDTAAAAE